MSLKCACHQRSVHLRNCKLEQQNEDNTQKRPTCNDAQNDNVKQHTEMYWATNCKLERPNTNNTQMHQTWQNAQHDNGKTTHQNILSSKLQTWATKQKQNTNTSNMNKCNATTIKTTHQNILNSKLQTRATKYQQHTNANHIKTWKNCIDKQHTKISWAANCKLERPNGNKTQIRQTCTNAKKIWTARHQNILNSKLQTRATKYKLNTNANNIRNAQNDNEKQHPKIYWAANCKLERPNKNKTQNVKHATLLKTTMSNSTQKCTEQQTAN